MEKNLVGENIFREANTNLSKEDILMLSPLQLAYIGDGVYELLVRTYLLDRKLTVNQLHKKATYLVKAKSQAAIVNKLDKEFTEKERDLIRRGRNTKSNTSPKNADIIDYKYATGFETMIGYLYLKEDYARLKEIFTMIISVYENRGDDNES